MNLPFCALTTAQQLTPQIIQAIFDTTDRMQHSINTKGRINALQDKIIALLFFEPSSRTMLSFQSSAQRLMAGTIFAQNANTTSLQKGETLEDMIRITASYSDLIVMRHADIGSADIAAQVSSVPFINAGDGSNQHPSQALIDAYTIYKHIGRLDNLRITFGFDALQSRSIHSLSQLLSQYSNNHFTFIGPESLLPNEDFIAQLTSKGVRCECQDSTEIPAHCDVIYINRLQQERFNDVKVFEQHRRHYRITKSQAMQSKAIILDPLPRIDEIDPEVDALPNALYFQQASYGVAVRMALLSMLLS